MDEIQRKRGSVLTPDSLEEVLWLFSLSMRIPPLFHRAIKVPEASLSSFQAGGKSRRFLRGKISEKCPPLKPKMPPWSDKVDHLCSHSPHKMHNQVKAFINKPPPPLPWNLATVAFEAWWPKGCPRHYLAGHQEKPHHRRVHHRL